MKEDLAIIREELREEILLEHQSSLAEAREKFQTALDDKSKYFDGNEKFDLYRTCIPDKVKLLKTGVQFLIGFFLIFTLTTKGILEIAQTFNLLDNLYFQENAWFKSEELYQHILNIKSFVYIGNALAISAGIELSYMLFTDGPDETIEPLMLAIAAAAFYTISESPENSWAMLGYAFSLLVLMVCLKLYKRWKL
ncbi:hypothetical protein [Vibrio sp. K4]|uniref:hypothetical protein n=1 Tax=Vibrio sp. K4 TaxID=3391579 RepID=UPI003DA79BA1